MNLTIKVLHKRLSKAHTWFLNSNWVCHIISPWSLFLWLISIIAFVWSTIVIMRRSPMILLIFVSPLLPLSKYFSKAIIIKFCHLHSWCPRGELLWIMNYNKQHSKNVVLTFQIPFFNPSPCKLLHNEKVIKFNIDYRWSLKHYAACKL